MASIYTDDVRIAHYEACKKRAKLCGILFGVSMWAMMLIALTECADLLTDGVFGGLLGGEIGMFVKKLCTAAVTVFAALACWRRDWRLLLGALLGASLCAVLGLFGIFGVFSPPFLLAALIAGIGWQRLSQEEGFPQFEIPYEEKIDRQRVEQLRIRSRAQTLAPVHDNIMDELE